MSVLSETRGLLSGLSIVGLGVLLAVSIDLGVPGQELLGTLRFHIAVAILALPLALLLSGARWRALVMFVLVALSLAQGVLIVVAQQERRSGFDAREPLASFRALSFNVLRSNAEGASAARYVIGTDADVVVLMEAEGVEPGFPAIAERYPYRVGCEPEVFCDLVILSRTPFVAQQKHQLWALNRWRLSQATTEIGGKSITIVALHMTKPYYDGLAELELRQAKAAIEAISGPVLLVGDFNAAAWSYDIDAFADALNLVPPPYYPATWPVEYGALGVPIDNMFTRGAALIRDIAPTPEAFGSNHLGLLATVDLY